MIAKVNKADLWGNRRDGFDNNGEHTVLTSEIDRITKRALLKLAREVFVGTGHARSENKTLPMTARGIALTRESSTVLAVRNQADGSIEDVDIAYECWDIEYLGTYVGHIAITQE